MRAKQIGPIEEVAEQVIEFVVFATIFTLIVLLTGGPSNHI